MLSLWTMIAAATRAGPYRTKLPVLAPRIDDLRWRRQASRGAIVLLWVLGLKTILTSEISGLFVLVGLWATWHFTAPRANDDSLSRRLATALRVLACFDALLLLTAIILPHNVQLVLEGLIRPVLPIVGMLYVSVRLKLVRLWPSARRAKWGALLLTSGFALTDLMDRLIERVTRGPWAQSAFVPYLLVATALLWICWLLGYVQAFFLTLRLRSALEIKSHEWWLDEPVLPEVRWVSYARMSNGAVEILLPGGDELGFADEYAAINWAFGKGLVPAEKALKQKLVKQSPEPL